MPLLGYYGMDQGQRNIQVLENNHGIIKTNICYVKVIFVKVAPGVSHCRGLVAIFMHSRSIPRYFQL